MSICCVLSRYPMNSGCFSRKKFNRYGAEESRFCCRCKLRLYVVIIQLYGVIMRFGHLAVWGVHWVSADRSLTIGEKYPIGSSSTVTVISAILAAVPTLVSTYSKYPLSYKSLFPWFSSQLTPIQTKSFIILNFIVLIMIYNIFNNTNRVS